jgi:hypothetical protein
MTVALARLAQNTNSFYSPEVSVHDLSPLFTPIAPCVIQDEIQVQAHAP